MSMTTLDGLGIEPVKFYDSERRFGILQDRWGHGPRVFFHLNDGRAAYIDPLQDKVLFGTSPVTRTPRVGELLIFRRGKNSEGPKAIQWIYEEELTQLCGALPSFRIRKVRIGPGYDGPRIKPEEDFYWWRNICVLNTFFARGNGPKLLPPYRGEDGHGSFDLVWERGLPENESGNYHHVERAGWVICEDPRHESLR